MKKMDTRIEWIDIAKGISMLCVIAGHLSDSNINRIVYGFHLTVFFLLSGYTLKKVEFNSNYIANKFSRIMKPYFYTCFLVMLFDLINAIIIYHDARITTLTSIIVRDLIRSFFASGSITTFGTIELGSRIGAIWFLPALFFAIVLVQWCIYQYPSIKKQYIILDIISICSYISAQFLWLPYSIQSGGMCAIFLLIGRDIKKYEVLKKLNLWHYIIVFMIATLGVYKRYTYIYYVTCNVPDLIFSLIVALNMSIILFYLAQYIEKAIGFLRLIKKGLLFVGRNSMLYLCVHLFELETLTFEQSWLLSKLIIPEALFVWARFVLKVIIVTGIVILLRLVQRFNITNFLSTRANKEFKVSSKPSRNTTIDIEKGFLITIMLIGHVAIDPTLRKIIYSFHMAAFVLLSGYFYKGSRKTKNELLVVVKSFLIPYVIFCMLHAILNKNNASIAGIAYNIKLYIFGMSFSKKILTDIPSIGPVYFILLLLVTRILYYFIDHAISSIFVDKQNMKSLEQFYKIFLVAGLSTIGLYLGNWGFWLPWSIDIALYCVAFYQIGLLCKQYHILDWCYQNSWIYFLLAPLWAYAIFSGNMEIAIRNYEPYGIVIIGAISGTILLYMLSEYFKQNTHPCIVKIISLIGESTLFILLIHTLLGSKIGEFYTNWFDSLYIYHMVANIGTQIILGLVVGSLFRILPKKQRNRTN